MTLFLSISFFILFIILLIWFVNPDLIENKHLGFLEILLYLTLFVFVIFIFYSIFYFIFLIQTIPYLLR
jgi:hypothetical protein